MSKNLVIVESPAKAKTIEGYLGKDYKVTSSYGHVRDLPKGNNAIDIENGFEPTYEITKDKKEVVAQLKKLAKEAEVIWLATDDDREGEAISWHLHEALNLNDRQTRRIVFREITKQAINNAITNPREIDIDLVNAQQARRVLDRLVGFELSPVLWKKIKTGLSAGRVQSVAVRIVVEREREREKFDATSDYRVAANFISTEGRSFEAVLNKRFKEYKEALEFVKACTSSTFEVSDLEVKPTKKSPAPPFTTSTLQQEASRKMGFSVSQTMTLAQKLYEKGKISYMRTDSLNLSDEAKAGAKKEIESSFGKEFAHARHFKTKSANAQEAHEAIRPTSFGVASVGGDRGEQRLYELIWKRAIASQMADAQLEKTNVQLGISNSEHVFKASGEVIKFEGFLKVYLESSDDEDEEEAKGMLPKLSKGDRISNEQVKATQKFANAPARYTEASLVKKLEELGIGRPSTYAPTISTVQKRGYVLKESRDGNERKYQEVILKNGDVKEHDRTEITGAEKNKLFPTDVAMVVTDFLVKQFPNVIDFSFTAKVEKEFDEIADGRLNWRTMIDSFYNGGFHQKVEDAADLSREDVGGDRILGKDPKTGKTLLVRLGRFGPMAQIGESEGEEKPIYAGLRKGQFLETITLEDALELFKLPRDVGMFEDKKIVAAVGRFGPYLRHDSKFYSLPKEEDPLEVGETRSIEIIEAKRKADAEKLIKTFDEDPTIQILNGRWGPFIKAGKKNVKIPKDKEPTELTLEECLDLAAKTPEKKGRGGFKKAATAAKKPAAKKKPAKKKAAPKKKK